MKPKAQHLVLALIIASASQWACALEKSTEAEAIALIQKAQEYLKKNGMEKSILEFNRLDSPFNSISEMNKKGDLYLFSVDSKGYQAIHGKNPKIPGKVMIDMRDSDGVYIIKDLVKACMESKDGKGWTQYRWPNPVSKEVEVKRGYIEKVPGVDMCLGTGIYK
ncbi:cache domain-containing protein [Undibacterium sp. Ren11W]|uniref:cache domain-containing protein n=1 Tax=Undibacterium sp. Ren11W TaxID=3413045 RepID=UPI003BEF7029